MTRDPFEYKLRGKAQLDEEHKIKPPVFDCRLTYTWYNWADGVFKDRNRKVFHCFLIFEENLKNYEN